MAIEPQSTTSEQSTLKIEKCFLWDPDPSPPAYQVATLVKRKSWKAMIDSGQDPIEGIFFYIEGWLFAGCWMWLYSHKTCILYTIHRLMGVWHCKGLHHFIKLTCVRFLQATQVNPHSIVSLFKVQQCTSWSQNKSSFSAHCMLNETLLHVRAGSLETR